MLARLSAFVIWALVAATAVFWGMRLFVSAPQAPLHAVPVGEVAALRADTSRLLGVTPALSVAALVIPDAASRFRLIGVMAPRPGKKSATSQQGVALIAVDGKPAKAFGIGSRLDGDLTLQSVGLRSASIATAPGQPPLMLELPPLAPPATGTLPALNLANPGAGNPLPPPTMQPVPPAPPLRPPVPPPQRDVNPTAQ